jgi:hypothetical protein
MSVSSTTFAERLTRLASNSVKLYAGNETPQEYESANLICAKPKVKRAYWTSITIGGGLDTLAGHMFKTSVGIEMFFFQTVPVLFSIIESNEMIAGICLAMLAGPVCSIAFQIFGDTKPLLSQFLWSYSAGSIAAKAMAWYYFYLTITA